MQERRNGTGRNQFVAGEVVAPAVAHDTPLRRVLFVFCFAQWEVADFDEQRRFFIGRDEIRLIDHALRQTLGDFEQLPLFHLQNDSPPGWIQRSSRCLYRSERQARAELQLARSSETGSRGRRSRLISSYVREES